MVNYLLKHWPITNSSKEVLIINEIEEVSPPLTLQIIDISPIEQVKKFTPNLLSRLARTVISNHF